MRAGLPESEAIAATTGVPLFGINSKDWRQVARSNRSDDRNRAGLRVPAANGVTRSRPGEGKDDVTIAEHVHGRIRDDNPM